MSEKAADDDKAGPSPLRQARELLRQSREQWPEAVELLRQAQKITSSYPTPHRKLPDTTYMTAMMLKYIQQADRAIARAQSATSEAQAAEAISEADQAVRDAIGEHTAASRTLR